MTEGFEAQSRRDEPVSRRAGIGAAVSFAALAPLAKPYRFSRDHQRER